MYTEIRSFLLVTAHLMTTKGEAQFSKIVVQTTYGQLLGTRHTIDYGIGKDTITNTVDEWLGVPYGTAKRWKPATFPDQWEFVKSAEKYGPVCPQVSYYSQTDPLLQHEDCLVLNIYSPFQKSQSNILYPVMLYIHGGSYEEGSGNRYNGFPLATYGVVVVTINYRLAELGYLTTGNDVIRGNYGLTDQILALKWVSENIGQFRGDKSCVTIFGNSAGASSVGLLMTTPETKGLFHRAIMQSGSPLAFWAIHLPDVDFIDLTTELAKYVGCTEGDLVQLVKCMEDVTDYKFTNEHWSTGRYSPSWLNFKPRIDYNILPDFPEKLFTQGKYHNVPVMAGLVGDEWARNAGWFYSELPDDSIDKYLDDGLDRQSFIDAIHHIVQERFHWPVYIADVLIQMYTNITYPNDPRVNRKNYVDFMGDLAMYSPSIRLAELMSMHNTSVYMYQFNEPSEYTIYQWWGAYHSLELDMVFGSPFTGYNIARDHYIKHTERDKQLSRDIMKLWTTFAKSGQPEKNSRGNGTTKWELFNPDKVNYLHISADKMYMDENLRAETMPFWNHVLPSLLKVPWVEHFHKPTIWTHNPYVWIFFAFTLVLLLVLCFVMVKYCQLRHKLIKLRSLYTGNQSCV